MMGHALRVRREEDAGVVWITSRDRPAISPIGPSSVAELGAPDRLRLETCARSPGLRRGPRASPGLRRQFPGILMAAGALQLKPPLPFTPGLEGGRDRQRDRARRRGRGGRRPVITSIAHRPLMPRRRCCPRHSSSGCRAASPLAEGACSCRLQDGYHALATRAGAAGETLLVHGPGRGRPRRRRDRKAARPTVIATPRATRRSPSPARAAPTCHQTTASGLRREG